MRHPGVQKAFSPVIGIRRAWLRRRRARLAAVFSDVVSGELTVRIPRFRGSFTIDWRSDILRDVLTYGDYEAELASAISSHIDPNRDIVDVGANVGLYSVLFAGLASSGSRVLAVEPAPGAVRYLRVNIAQNAVDSVLVFEGVVAESSGWRTIHVIQGMEEYSSLHRVLHSGFGEFDQEEIEVQAETLDGLVARFELNPGFVKLDIEGAEYVALQGAHHVLEVHRPVLLIESSDTLLKPFGVNIASLYALLTGHGYELRSAVHPKAPIDHGGNILAVPVSNRRRA